MLVIAIGLIDWCIVFYDEKWLLWTKVLGKPQNIWYLTCVVNLLDIWSVLVTS